MTAVLPLCVLNAHPRTDLLSVLTPYLYLRQSGASRPHACRSKLSAASPYAHIRFSQSAPECSRDPLFQTALSVGDAVFLSASDDPSLLPRFLLRLRESILPHSRLPFHVANIYNTTLHGFQDIFLICSLTIPNGTFLSMRNHRSFQYAPLLLRNRSSIALQPAKEASAWSGRMKKAMRASPADGYTIPKRDNIIYEPFPNCRSSPSQPHTISRYARSNSPVYHGSSMSPGCPVKSKRRQIF